MREITFEIRKNPKGRGYWAIEPTHGIQAEGNSKDAIRRSVKEATARFFAADPQRTDRLRFIRLRFVHDEVILA